MKCPQCGKFLKECVATVGKGGDEISRVEGQCKTHGTVEPTDWCWEDFFPEGDSTEWFMSQRS